MFTSVASVLCYLVLLIVKEAASQDCLQLVCPSKMEHLVLQPGVHSTICLDFPYNQLDTEWPIQPFNTMEEICSDDGNLSCMECSVHPINNITNSNCTYGAAVVRCITLELDCPRMPVPQVSSGSGSDESSEVDSSDEDEVQSVGLLMKLKGIDFPYPDCYLLLQNITWHNDGCNIEESHDALTDSCSGVGEVYTNAISNTSEFIVENAHISEVGDRALLIANSTPFCGDYSFNTSQGLLCQVENVSGLDDGAGNASSNMSSSMNYLIFRCPGDWSNVIGVGRARIVFRRKLSTKLDSQCQSLSVARPYYSEWASIPVLLDHRESNNLCDRVSDVNLNECLEMCISNITSNGLLCDTLVKLILNGDRLEERELEAVLTILDRLNNVSTVDSLEKGINLVDMLLETIDRVNSTLSPNGQEMFVSVVDEMLANEYQWTLLQQRQRKRGVSLASSLLLDRLEMFLDTVGKIPENNLLKFNGTHITSLQIETITPQSMNEGYFMVNFPKGIQDITQNFLLIPEQLLCAEEPEFSYNKDCSSTVATALVYSLPLYLDQISISQQSLFVNSPLLILSVPLQANPEFPIQDYPIELHITPVTPNATGVTNHSCMFWDFNIRDWSAKGVTTRVGADGSYICTSTHLTSFAVLVGLTPPTNNNTTSVEERALNIVTYIGSGISLFCLVLSLLVFISCGKRLNKGVLLYIHINFCLALCLALLVFISGIESAARIEILCQVVAVFLHYLFLCAFCWMLAEGIMLYILVVKVFGKLASRWYYLLLLGWGLPIPIVAVSVGIQHRHYGTEHFCWLSTEGGVIWAFVGPMLLIVCVNSVFLVLTVCSLLRSRKYGGAERGVGVLQLVRSGVKSTLILLPLLGLTWVLGIFALNRETVVFAWLFTVCNSLQGFLFFVIHVLRNKKVRTVIKRVVCCHSSASKSQQTSITNNISAKFNVTTDGSSYAVNRVGLSYSEVNESQQKGLLMDRSFSQVSTESTNSTVDLSSSA